MNGLVLSSSVMQVPVLVGQAGDRAGMRFLEFFTANIRNPNTRRSYARAADEFLNWCAVVGVSSLSAIIPLHVSTWIEPQLLRLSVPSVKQRLAALRR